MLPKFIGDRNSYTYRRRNSSTGWELFMLDAYVPCAVSTDITHGNIELVQRNWETVPGWKPLTATLHRDNWDGPDMLLVWTSPDCQGEWCHHGCDTRALKDAPDLRMVVDWTRLWRKLISTTPTGSKWQVIVLNGERCWNLCDSFSCVSAEIPGNFSLGLFPKQGKV